MSDALWTVILVGVGSPIIMQLLTYWVKKQERAEDRADRAAVALALKDVGTKIDGMLQDRDRANRLEGEHKGVAAGAEIARVLAEGQRQGAETARANAAANIPVPIPSSGAPLPVSDEQTAAAVHSVVAAIRDSAADKS